MRRVLHRRPPGRRGFTLIEFSVGLISSSVLMLGLAGSLFLATQANRIDLGPFRHSSAGAIALDEATRELSYATKVREATPGRSIEFEVPDRTGDGSADVVRYEWSGTPGGPLKRWFNGGTSSNVAVSLHDFDLRTTSRTVTEQTIGNVTNTSGLTRWYDKSSATLLEGSTSLGSGDGVGTDFLPTLPEGALTWTPTRIEVRCRASGTKSGVIRVRLWTADSWRRPETLLAESTISESNLDDDWSWHAIHFSPAPSVGISQRICITFQHHSGSNTVMQLREDALGLGFPFWKLSTANGGSSWQQSINKAIYLRVYGSYTYTMEGIVDVNRTYQRSISLEAQSGSDSTARMTGTARLRNKVEAP